LCVCCVQHVVLVLAGFRTKAGERVGVAGPGGRCRRAPPRPCQLRHGPDDPPSIDPHDLRGSARVPARAAQPRPDRGDRACGHRLHDSAGKPRRRAGPRPTSASRNWPAATVAGATASARSARATAKPSHHHPGPQPRRARARAHAHRV